MTIQIGEKTLAIRKPKDIEADLAVFGTNASETRAQLRGNPTPGHLARALQPHLADTISVPELAAAIALVDQDEVRAGILKLYETKEEAKADAKTDGTSTAGSASK